MGMLPPGHPNRVAIENQLVQLAQAGRLAVNMNSPAIAPNPMHNPVQAAQHANFANQIINSVNNAIANRTPAALYIHHHSGHLTILPAPVHAAAAGELFESDAESACSHCGSPQGGRWYRSGGKIIVEGA
jgi:hypothetical protein